MTSFGDSRLPSRFWNKVRVEANGCWIWTAATSRHGYGNFWVRGSMRLAHRISYVNLKGIIPFGFDIDHLCKIKPCVNPDHLEAVSHKENVRRGDLRKVSPKRAQCRTHCKHGHKFTPENTYTRSNRTGRECRICMRESCQRRSERKSKNV